MIDFPANPTVGQEYTAAGVTWAWDGVKWTAATADSVGVFLPLLGGTMTGDIVLKGDPSAPLNPVTKQMFDARPIAMNDNRLINGDMRIDQRNNGASGTAGGYTIDRWQYAQSQNSKITWARNANSSPSPHGFSYSLLAQSSSAYVSLASDFFQFAQTIEADMISDFQWGTPTAQPVTLSFWAYSSLTGTHSGCLGNNTSTRSYPFTYSIPTANIWTKVVVTIPGDIAGTWVMSGNGGGAVLHFDLGSGATYRGPAGAWASAGLVGATGAVSLVATNGASWLITGVKLEIGSVATPFNRQSLAKSLADCQRYYQVIGGHIIVSGYSSTGAAIWTPLLFPVVMRAVPTIVYNAVSYGNASGLVLTAATTTQVTNQAAIASGGGGYAIGQIAASAEL
jgi:hypothetical protein